MRGLRWFTWKIACGLTRLFYRLRVEGQQHLPGSGGALLVSNHLSLVDGLILAAANLRYVRFVMHERYYRKPILGAFARLAGAIPLSAEQRPRELVKSLRAAADAVRQGDLVSDCVPSGAARTRWASCCRLRWAARWSTSPRC